jgi:hypothetical protein
MNDAQSLLQLLQKLGNPSSREETILGLKEFQVFQKRPKFVVYLQNISSPASSLQDDIRLLAAVCLKNTLLNDSVSIAEEEMEFLKTELLSVIFVEKNDSINGINCFLISIIAKIQLFEGKWFSFVFFFFLEFLQKAIVVFLS